jgi:hypothetical protein
LENLIKRIESGAFHVKVSVEFGFMNLIKRIESFLSMVRLVNM